MKYPTSVLRDFNSEIHPKPVISFKSISIKFCTLKNLETNLPDSFVRKGEVRLNKESKLKVQAQAGERYLELVSRMLI